MTSEKITVHNPATGQVIEEVDTYSFEQGVEAIGRAREAQKRWAAMPLAGRIEIMRRFQHALVGRAQEVCELIARENGKPLTEAMTTEVMPIVDLTSYFCGRAPHVLERRPIPLHLMMYRKSYIHYRPRGVLLVISPWNFPFTIPTGEIVMALIAGNAVVHKPASLTPLIALKTRELFDEAGLDPDLYQVRPMSGSTAFRLISQGVDYVNFTGSTEVGQKVAAECGRNLIPCSMELGGKDPAIICEDADLNHAVGAVVWGAFANAGQVCASVERAYVHESLYDKFVEKVVEKVNTIKVGDPFEDGVSMGPMVDPHQLQIVVDQVDRAKQEGAKILTGGYKIEGPGQFYAPTVMVDVNDQMECVREETFGPTLPIMKFRDDEDAIRRANDSIYGLNAYVFSKSKTRSRRIAEQLQAGTVMINEVLVTHGCPETPWSGVKKSGVGRVHSDDGLRDLCVSYHVNYDLLRQPAWSPFWQPYSHAMFKGMLATIRTLYGKGLGGRVEGIRAFFGVRSKLATGSAEPAAAHK